MRWRDRPTEAERALQVNHDALVERAASMMARALLYAEDPEGLWGHVRERVESERERIESDTIRDALEPLQERFPMHVVARVAAAMAEESAAEGANSASETHRR
jgi:hypothetical protein